MDNITIENGFHLSTTAVNAIVDSFKGPLEAIGKTAGTNCIVSGSTSSGGYLIYNGEILPFASHGNGLVKNYIQYGFKIKERNVGVTYKDGHIDEDAIIHRYVEAVGASEVNDQDTIKDSDLFYKKSYGAIKWVNSYEQGNINVDDKYRDEALSLNLSALGMISSDCIAERYSNSVRVNAVLRATSGVKFKTNAPLFTLPSIHIPSSLEGIMMAKAIFQGNSMEGVYDIAIRFRGRSCFLMDTFLDGKLQYLKVIGVSTTITIF